MEKYMYCWYKFIGKRILNKSKSKVYLVWSCKHEPFSWFYVIWEEIKDLMIRWLYYGERIEKEWREKKRIIYYFLWWYIDKIIWWGGFWSKGGEEWIYVSGYINLVNEEVKKVIEEELWEKVKEELEFLPVIMRWRFWDDNDGFEKVEWEDIWWEVEVEKWWEIRWYYIMNALNKIYKRDVNMMIKSLWWDKVKVEEKLKKIYDNKIFVDYILDSYEPEWNKFMSMETYIKKEYASKIDKKIKPKIYELSCKNNIKYILEHIDYYLNY